VVFYFTISRKIEEIYKRTGSSQKIETQGLILNFCLSCCIAALVLILTDQVFVSPGKSRLVFGSILTVVLLVIFSLMLYALIRLRRIKQLEGTGQMGLSTGKAAIMLLANGIFVFIDPVCWVLPYNVENAGLWTFFWVFDLAINCLSLAVLCNFLCQICLF
jgi:hypothetical protein